MTKQVIHTDEAPAAIGPYSQAIAFDRLIFCTGQIALSPNNEPAPATAAEQTHRVLKNLQAVLKAAGSDLDHVLKVTVFVKNMDDFGAINAVYSEYFTKNPPARSTVEVACLPRDMLVEIEAIAVKA